jgi:hypothetical protein
MCHLRGLVNFPFDELACVLRFGGWARGGSQQNLTFLTDTPLDVRQARMAMYQEYAITDGSVTRGVDSFSCCPDVHGFPYVQFELTVRASSRSHRTSLD